MTKAVEITKTYCPKWKWSSWPVLALFSARVATLACNKLSRQMRECYEHLFDGWKTDVNTVRYLFWTVDTAWSILIPSKITLMNVFFPKHMCLHKGQCYNPQDLNRYSGIWFTERLINTTLSTTMRELSNIKSSYFSLWSFLSFQISVCVFYFKICCLFIERLMYPDRKQPSSI